MENKESTLPGLIIQMILKLHLSVQSICRSVRGFSGGRLTRPRHFGRHSEPRSRLGETKMVSKRVPAPTLPLALVSALFTLESVTPPTS